MNHDTVVYVVSNDFVKVSSQLPSNKNRSVLVHTLIKELGLLASSEGDLHTRLQPLRPTPASVTDLALYHDRDYLEYVLNPKHFNAEWSPIDSAKAAEFGIEEDCPWFRELPAYIRLVGGASLTAANALAQGQATIAINWEGGRHHAQKSQASGFCYVADCVLAILTLKRARIPCLTDLVTPNPPLRKARVLYLDLDLHFSDGVSHAFQNTPGTSQILTLSLHHAAPGFFPISELSSLPPTDPDPNFDPFTLSVPLSRGASCQTFFSVWTNCVERVKESFQPDFVVLQCGVDGLAGDTYGIWNWSLGGREGRDEEGIEEGSLGWCVNRVCHSWGCKTLLLGGGGYNSPNAARAWAYLTSIALNKPLSLQTPIPDHTFFPYYAPSFTLDVPPNNMPDENTLAYLEDVNRRFGWVCEEIRTRLK
ncbi:hypothetical protein QCA50_020810 [Cerrena zonata]|uniref:histone deacetylase n=1 Tax=Cerrena zonata TaxID=2478898 RepID=A0AAW0F769_9APHY